MVGLAFDEQVEMVGHEAVRENCELKIGCSTQELLVDD
jgi:hypothetical protein